MKSAAPPSPSPLAAVAGAWGWRGALGGLGSLGGLGALTSGSPKRLKPTREDPPPPPPSTSAAGAWAADIDAGVIPTEQRRFAVASGG